MLVAISNLLRVLKLTAAIGSEKFSELGYAHRQKSSGGAGSGGQYCCGCDACWAHIFLLGGMYKFYCRLRMAGE
jgi:hypothetical protein